MFVRWSLSVVILLFCFSVLSLAQSPPAPDPRLTACQEQLADVRSAVTKIHQPNAAFQAEALVTLDRKFSEAQQQQARDAETIAALRKEVEALKPPAKPEG